MEQLFKLPSLGELRQLTEEQLKLLFFALEQHRSRQLLDASEEYTERIEKANKDYANTFQVLSDVLAEKRSKTAYHKNTVRKEYCTTVYDNKIAKVISANQKYKKYADIRRELKKLGVI